MIPLEFFILAAGLLGALIGMLGTHLYYRRRLAGKERQTWNTARIFYTRRNQDA